MITLLRQLAPRLTQPQTKRALVASLVVGAFALAFVIPPPTAQAGNPQNGSPYTLEGTWRLEVAGTPPFPDFVSYETFTENGGSVETDHGVGGPCVAIGTWRRTSPREFLATLYKQLFQPAPAGPFPFEPTGTVKIRRLITIDSNGSELTGVGTVEIFDQAGILLGSSTGPLRGSRIVAEPPDL